MLQEKTVDDVYKKIIYAIGNNNPQPPDLKLVDSERNPASYNPQTKVISLEHKVLEVCYSFGSDSLNALSYILSHELGHHYRHHGWMSQYASSDFGSSLSEHHRTPEQRKFYEIESDIYAGFYSHIAGYDALKVASSFLDSIYVSYDLPVDLKHYPTLVERKDIIKNNQSVFKVLKEIFDLANITMSIGYYDYSQVLYQYIINRDFTSREIYNNLGLCYVYQALDLDIEQKSFNLIIPFNIDMDTRLNVTGKTRSLNVKAVNLLYDAKQEFERAIQLDDNYIKAKENLYYTNLMLSSLGENIINNVPLDYLLNNNEGCDFCLKGVNAAFNEKNKKSRKFFKSGSSDCDICEINVDFSKNLVKAQKKEDKIQYDLINGVDMMDCFFRKRDCDIYEDISLAKICIEDMPSFRLFKLSTKNRGRSACAIIQKVDKNTDSIVNNVNVFIGDDIRMILEEYKNVKIIESSNKRYLLLPEENISFLIMDGKIQEWYIFQRYDQK